MRSTLLIILCCFLSQANAQVKPIEWGELQRKQGALLYLLPGKQDEFYALRWAGGRLFGHYKVSLHKKLKSRRAEKIRLQADGSIANFEGARVINDQFVVFLSDKRDGQNHFYMQVFTDSLEPKSDAIHLASYELGKGRSKGEFRVRKSENDEYFGVIWEIPGKKDQRHVYGFKIFDRNLNMVNDGEYPLPFEPKLSTIHEHYVSNTGDYYICLTEYEEPERKRWFKDHTTYKSLHIYRLNDDLGLQDFELDLDGRRVVAMAMQSDGEGIFTVTGIYGEKDQSGVAGVFFQRIDLETEEVLEEGFQVFEESFITQDWSERELERARRREERGKGAPRLYNYIMRDVSFQEDGSIIGTLEQYYIQVRSTTDGRSGQSSSVYYYYYNDIIAYKIDAEGEFNWVNKIRKYQVSINDGGPYSSYGCYLGKDKGYFIFNDNSRNYDEAGDFLNDERLYTANYGKKRNAVALVELDMETGEIKRKTFLERSETNTLVVPKLFNVNYDDDEMLLYSVSGRKEKIGIIRFKR